MTVLILGLVLLGLLFGVRRLLTAAWAGLAAWGQRPLSYWRPASGLGAVAMLILAFVLGVREDWLPAAAFALMSAGMAIGARKRRAATSAGGEGESAPGTSAGEMSERDARAMLGVDDQASPEEIEAAYRRLIRRVHPDLGGAAGLAAQLNAARTRLQGKG